jgi:hypothetical protein
MTNGQEIQTGVILDAGKAHTDEIASLLKGLAVRPFRGSLRYSLDRIEEGPRNRDASRRRETQ